jgi:hypothetical protein
VFTVTSSSRNAGFNGGGTEVSSPVRGSRHRNAVGSQLSSLHYGHYIRKNQWDSKQGSKPPLAEYQALTDQELLAEDALSDQARVERAVRKNGGLKSLLLQYIYTRENNVEVFDKHDVVKMLGKEAVGSVARDPAKSYFRRSYTRREASQP